MKRVLLILSSLTPLLGFSQVEGDEAQEIQEFTATVINAQTEFPLESVHVVNLNQVKVPLPIQKENLPFPLR